MQETGTIARQKSLFFDKGLGMTEMRSLGQRWGTRGIYIADGVRSVCLGSCLQLLRPVFDSELGLMSRSLVCCLWPNFILVLNTSSFWIVSKLLSCNFPPKLSQYLEAENNNGCPTQHLFPIYSLNNSSHMPYALKKRASIPASLSRLV